MSIKLSYILYFIFLFLVAALEPLALVVNAEVFQAVIPLIRYLAIILMVGVCILFLAKYIHSFALEIMLATFIALTMISFRFANYPAFANISVITFVMIIFVSVVIFLILIKWAFNRNKKPTKSLYAYTLLIGLVSPGIQFFEIETYGATVDAPESSYTLNSKPNIYLLSYDSMVPPDIMRELLVLEEIPHEKVLMEQFHVMEKSISFHVPSKPSINDLMRIGQSSEPLNYGAFSGNANSLLSNILKKNGYKLITGFDGLYFGNAGPHIDKGLFPPKVDIQTSVLCISQRRFQKVQAGMICEVAFRLYRIKRLRKLYTILFGNNYSQKVKDWHTKLVSALSNTPLSGAPTFLYAYTYKGIGHTSSSYNHSDFSARESYKNEVIKNSKELSEQLRTVSDAIRTNDPNSILVIFGDHGMYLSRAIDFNEDPEFFVKDRHLVTLAIRKTGHACSEPQNLDLITEYVTPSRLLYAIFECLGTGVIVPNAHFDEDEALIPYAFPNN